MYNIVFIDIDKLGEGFPEKKEKLEQLSLLFQNVDKFGEYCTNHIYLVSKGTLEEKRFDMALLKVYFEAMALNRDDYVFMCGICKDAYFNGYTVLNELPIEEKMAFAVGNYYQPTVEKVTHITDEVNKNVQARVTGFQNLVLVENYQEETPAGIFAPESKNYTYVTSPKSGIEGFNDCFDTYFKIQKSLKRKKED